MLFVSFFKWWYSDGWQQRARKIATSLDGVIDYFSISLLVKTLFQPFRQDSNGRVDGALDAKMHALAENLISRVLGALIRLVVLIFGMLSIAAFAIWSVIVLVGWAIVPVAPLVGIVLASLGVVPSWEWLPWM